MKRYTPNYDYDRGAFMDEWPAGGWYDSDDVDAALEAKDREVAELRSKIADKDAILHHSAVAATAARNRINDLKDRLAAVRARCEGNNWGGTARMCEYEQNQT
jgi:hypothetical protein